MKKLILTLSVVFFVSCTTNTTYIEPSIDNIQNKDVVVSLAESVNEKTIYVEPGDMINIELEAVPSTGYSWIPSTSSDCNLEYIGQDSRDIYEDDRVGDPIISIFKYRSNYSGSCTIEFDYARSWEGESINTKRVKIVVK